VLPLLDRGRKLDILDLGAGTGWLSYRLARLGHRPVALDIITDSRDGLGAAHHYRQSLARSFPLVQAEFDNVPFGDAEFDLAIFNSSLHYSVDYVKTLSETRRCLRQGGSVVVLDSPIYRKTEHGMRMRQERHGFFESRYGTRSDAIPSIEFLDDRQLCALCNRLGMRWRVFRPWYGWRWHLRPLRAAWKRERPPSRFEILVGSWTR
jgi:SAM-dependent methyltransferase